jgi:uncharacterized membrane protein
MNDKSGRRLFKAGALWLLILGAVHSTSLFIKQVPANDTERQILYLMTSYRFNLMGSLRSMSDLMRGFSVAFMLAPLAFGVLDLMLSRERAGLLKRAALVQVIWLAAMIVVALRYFFAVPLSFLVVALLIFALAWLKLPADASN